MAMAPAPRYTNEQLAEAIRADYGMLSYVAAALGLSEEWLRR